MTTKAGYGLGSLSTTCYDGSQESGVRMNQGPILPVYGDYCGKKYIIKHGAHPEIERSLMMQGKTVFDKDLDVVGNSLDRYRTLFNRGIHTQVHGGPVPGYGKGKHHEEGYDPKTLAFIFSKEKVSDFQQEYEMSEDPTPQRGRTEVTQKGRADFAINDRRRPLPMVKPVVPASLKWREFSRDGLGVFE